MAAVVAGGGASLSPRTASNRRRGFTQARYAQRRRCDALTAFVSSREVWPAGEAQPRARGRSVGGIGRAVEKPAQWKSGPQAPAAPLVARRFAA